MGEWHCIFFERQSHHIFSCDHQLVSDIAQFVKCRLVTSFPSMNFSPCSMEMRTGPLQWRYFCSFWGIVHHLCHWDKPTDCQVLVCKSFHFIYCIYVYLNLQATIIIAKLSFWINKSFTSSVTEALDQYKQKGYFQKLKTDITPDIIHSYHQDLVSSLYGQVTHIDGGSFV